MSAPDRSILKSALDWLAEGRRVALATVIQTWGSAPQPVGSWLVIDGRQTHAKRVARLAHAGVAGPDIDRIHAPIGLDIGAQGSAEIALSIIAEIMAVQHGKATSQ
jgi:xanthine/CO dehydrogenase XdhC/CoxF family maturation factor